jgi:Domain of unknown function (DUF4328)
MILPPCPAAPSSTAAPPLGDLFAMYRSPRTRSKLVTAALVVEIAALTVVGLVLWERLGVARAIAAGEEVSAGAIAALQRPGNIDLLSLAVLLTCAVTFCLWTYRVAHNAVALGGRLSISPGSAVGYFFIPLLNWWMPYTALAQVYDASDPDPRAERCAPTSHVLLLVWWLSWLLSSSVDLLAICWVKPRDVTTWATQLQLGLLSVAVQAAAAILAIAVVWKLTRRQEDRAAALVPTARIA